MSKIKAFEIYLQELAENAREEHTEHTNRLVLQSLLKAFAPGDADVKHEPPRVKGKGAPDFRISHHGMILGYVETKKIDENLKKVLKSNQIERYKTLSDNILLTDYLRFIWLHKNNIQGEAALCRSVDELTNPRFKPRAENIAAVEELLKGFFSVAPEGIGRAQDLALALAARSKLLRDYLSRELIRQKEEHQEGRLYGLFNMFSEQVFQELELEEFADAFAQMLAYGLFLARLNSGTEKITLNNAREHISGSFKLIRELVEFLAELNKPEYRDVRWVVDEVLSIINSINLSEIQEDLSFRQRKAINRRVRAVNEDEHRLFERDPFIYFYENYLAEHAPKVRETRGVYYTPPPVVNFIVRTVDDVLKDKFNIKEGLADQRVTALDFACGTGTFLLEIFQRIFENIGGPNSGRADLIVREHILKNICGFEYLIAPYTIAHLKLSQYLSQQSHPLSEDQRLQVLLTNTLEPIDPQANYLLPAVSAEVQAAQDVKEKPVLVITGNPPYFGNSKNKGAWIKAAIDEYKHVWGKNKDGLDERKPLDEKNSKWLQDDYVKFLRFAQMKMDGYSHTAAGPDGKPVEHSGEGVDRGVVAVITNHSWLDNPTFRGMRQSLMRSFEQIYVLDLHGSTKRKERTPDGGKDENIFDIKQGVAISVFIKDSKLERGVWRSDVWGTRLEKYGVTATEDYKSIKWTEIDPDEPFYLLVWQDKKIRKEYMEGESVKKIFPVNVLGFQTHRDAFAVSFTEKEMKEKIKNLADTNISDEEIQSMYGIKSNRDWSLQDARAAVRNGEATKPQSVAYRPFDNRWSEYSTVTMDYPRRELINHVMGRENLCLLVPRQIGIADWRHAFVAAVPAESCLISTDTKSGNYVFPAFLHLGGGKFQENFSPDFRKFIDDRYKNQYKPEEIFGYIYAVLHALTYRARYAPSSAHGFSTPSVSKNRQAF